MLIRKKSVSSTQGKYFFSDEEEINEPYIYSGLLIITLWSERNCVFLRDKTELAKWKKNEFQFFEIWTVNKKRYYYWTVASSYFLIHI